jgi:hypothetical protein
MSEPNMKKFGLDKLECLAVTNICTFVYPWGNKAVSLNCSHSGRLLFNSRRLDYNENVFEVKHSSLVHPRETREQNSGFGKQKSR